MTARKTPVVTDIWSLKATVGLVETRKKWGVIDCIPNKGTEAFTVGLTGDDGGDLLDDEEDMLLPIPDVIDHMIMYVCAIT